MNAVIGTASANHGMTRILAERWLIDTWAANSNQYGLVVPANGDRKRLVLWAVDVVFGAWAPGDQIRMAFSAKNIEDDGAVIFTIGDAVAQQSESLFPAVDSVIDAPESLGLISAPAFTVTNVPVTGNTTPGTAQLSFEIRNFTGAIYLISVPDGGGSAVKSISFVEESGP